LFGAVAAVLGGFGAVGVMGVAMWVAVITTLSTSVAGFFQANRYEYLALSYSATARRLRNILDGWRTDQSQSDPTAFILECEETMSFENHSWLSEFLDDKQTGGV
jgi:hypothetical protein